MGRLFETRLVYFILLFSPQKARLLSEQRFFFRLHERFCPDIGEPHYWLYGIIVSFKWQSPMYKQNIYIILYVRR